MFTERFPARTRAVLSRKQLLDSQTSGWFSLLHSNLISPVAQQDHGGNKNRDTGERGPPHEGGRVLLQWVVPGIAMAMGSTWKTADTPCEPPQPLVGVRIPKDPIFRL